MLTRSAVEYNVAEYLLYNGQDLREEVLSLCLCAYDDKYRYEFIEQFLNELCMLLSERLDLPYVSVRDVVDKKFLNKMFGKQFLDFK